MYAVVEMLSELPPVQGLDGAGLARASSGGLELVVSEHPRADLQVTDAAILVHGRVVEELCSRSAAVLPARFGWAFGDKAELDRAVAPRAQKLRDALDRVRGCVELGLRVVGGPAQPVQADTGRAYMEARRARAEATERLARQVHEPLARLARADVQTVASEPRLHLNAAFLLEPGSVESFRGQVAELEAAHPDLSFVCTGPWPPYSFAALDA